MRLVVDTSVLFSFFNEKSVARELFTLPQLELLSPEFGLEEINGHKEDVKKWFSLSDAQFSFIVKLLQASTKFIPSKEYAEFFEEAMRLSVDPDDVDFFALALKLGCPVWSEDPHFTMQSEVKVLKTAELAKTHL